MESEVIEAVLPENANSELNEDHQIDEESIAHRADAINAALEANNISIPGEKDDIRMQIVVPDLPDGDYKIIMNFYEVNARWMTKFYRLYENVLYTKRFRDVYNEKTRSIFQCLVCKKEFCCFPSMKAHLGSHLNIYYLKCEYCDRTFNWRQSYQYHKRKQHGVVAA